MSHHGPWGLLPPIKTCDESACAAVRCTHMPMSGRDFARVTARGTSESAHCCRCTGSQSGSNSSHR
jgi:hypothetical protein